jgi:hypothetical protein
MAREEANFTEDGILVTPGGPISGREAIEKHYADDFKQGFHSRIFRSPRSRPGLVLFFRYSLRSAPRFAAMAIY